MSIHMPKLPGVVNVNEVRLPAQVTLKLTVTDRNGRHIEDYHITGKSEIEVAKQRRVIQPQIVAKNSDRYLFATWSYKDA